MEEETMEVPHSESGNESIEEVVETPSEETPVEETPEPEEELYELPDGRKVPADEVAQEYRNLLSDYTKKSQELASLKTPTEPEPANPLADPNYIPQTYEELAKQIEERTLQKLEAKHQAEENARQALEDSVVAQVAEIKTIDPTLNENSLFLHATKYGFRDLKLAHQNMKDMSDTMKKVQQNTATNIARRSDPVSASPGATGAKLNPSDFGSAVDYLRALKGQ